MRRIWKRRRGEQFRPHREQINLWPGVSGNRINGLGEFSTRAPTPLYWHPEGMSPFFPLQQWMLAQGMKQPELAARRAERAKVMGREPASIATQRCEASAAENVRAIKDKARAVGADLFGIAAPRPDWVFEGYSFDYEWIVMLGVAMDYEKLSTAPDLPAALAVTDGYTKCWQVSQPLADEIRSRGYRADARGGPIAGQINLIPAALACGFGELGKHGSIINRDLGSNFRLAAVFTDLPLLADQPVDIGAEDFCLNCQVCVDACPVGAISNTKQMVRGIEKWYVDFDRCVPFFNETYGCGICIAACPWSMPARGPVISEKMLRRRGSRPG